MAHNKVFGYCENLCKVEVQEKAKTETLFNENLLVNCDCLRKNFCCVEVDGQKTYPNINLTNMTIESMGVTPDPNATSGSCKFNYRITTMIQSTPYTLQLLLYNGETYRTENKTYLFTTLPTETYTETITLSSVTITLTISLTNNQVVVNWASNRAFTGTSTVSIVGAKMEQGKVATAFKTNEVSKGNLTLNLAADVAKFVIDNHNVSSLQTTNKTIGGAINEVKNSNMFHWKRDSSETLYVQTSGNLTSFGTWLKNNYVNNKWICGKVNPTESGMYAFSCFL